MMLNMIYLRVLFIRFARNWELTLKFSDCSLRQTAVLHPDSRIVGRNCDGVPVIEVAPHLAKVIIMVGN